jgi:hypothetical protein
MNPNRGRTACGNCSAGWVGGWHERVTFVGAEGGTPSGQPPGRRRYAFDPFFDPFFDTTHRFKDALGQIDRLQKDELVADKAYGGD